MEFRYWGAVAKDGSHVRDVKKASSREGAEHILFDCWTEELKALYEVRPVKVLVDEAAEAANQSNQG